MPRHTRIAPTQERDYLKEPQKIIKIHQSCQIRKALQTPSVQTNTRFFLLRLPAIPRPELQIEAPSFGKENSQSQTHLISNLNSFSIAY